MSGVTYKARGSWRTASGMRRRRSRWALGTCCPFFDLHIIGAKIDQNIGDKHHISGFYNQSYRNRNNYSGTPYLPVPGSATSGWQQQTTPGNMVRLSLNSTLTPTLLNRVAAGYNRFVNDNGAVAGTLDANLASKIGLQNLPGTMFPVFTFSGKEYQGGTIDQEGVGFADKSISVHRTQGLETFPAPWCSPVQATAALTTHTGGNSGRASVWPTRSTTKWWFEPATP
jgi:hypothetical protein